MDKTTEEKARELIGKAAAWLDEHGWCQQRYWRGGTCTEPERCCTYGALNFIVNGEANNTCSLVSKLLCAKFMIEKKVGTIDTWNDKKGQTKENVIKTLREIANA